MIIAKLCCIKSEMCWVAVYLARATMIILSWYVLVFFAIKEFPSKSCETKTDGIHRTRNSDYSDCIRRVWVKDWASEQDISDGAFSNSSLNMAICFEIGLCLYWAGSGLHSLTSQTHFTKILMNCVHKLCLTGLPLAQWCNQILNTAADTWNTDHEMHMPIKKYSRSVLNALAVLRNTTVLAFCCF